MIFIRSVRRTYYLAFAFNALFISADTNFQFLWPLQDRALIPRVLSMVSSRTSDFVTISESSNSTFFITITLIENVASICLWTHFVHLEVRHAMRWPLNLVRSPGAALCIAPAAFTVSGTTFFAFREPHSHIHMLFFLSVIRSPGAMLCPASAISVRSPGPILYTLSGSIAVYHLHQHHPQFHKSIDSSSTSSTIAKNRTKFPLHSISFS